MNDLQLTRRDLLVAGAALAAGAARAGASLAPAPVPTRRFGRASERVSILGLGGYFDPDAGAELLAAAHRLGVRYWEITLARGATAHGRYFDANPTHRDDVFLLAKARSATPDEMTRDLQRSLLEARTSRVDCFVVQGVSDPSVLTDAVRVWAERQKAAGAIRHFGFSTHANMATCVGRAAELGWIDGVVTTYNYRLMDDPDLNRAIEACARAGVAVTAIKSQALPTNPVADIGSESEGARSRLKPFLSREAALGQAKLQAVWSDPRVASVLSLMDPRLLEINAAAARAGGPTRGAADALREHARATASSYCAGCANTCESRLPAGVPVSRVMRYLMYANGYGDPTRARAAFAALPDSARRAMADADYRRAESACPQHIPIRARMSEALRTLG